MTSVRIGEIAHDGAALMGGAHGTDRVSVDLISTARANLCVTGSGRSSTITLSLDEAQELAALLTNAVTRASVLIAKAAEHEQEHTDLTERQQAVMTDLLKGAES
jgi:DNA-binding NarL/FixJ family response regulator